MPGVWRKKQASKTGRWRRQPPQSTKTEALDTLVGLGVDVNAYKTGSHSHATPLHNAVCSGSLEAVKMLAEAGARLDAKDAATRRRLNFRVAGPRVGSRDQKRRVAVGEILCT